jgi:hypothetical protein
MRSDLISLVIKRPGKLNLSIFAVCAALGLAVHHAPLYAWYKLGCWGMLGLSLYLLGKYLYFGLPTKCDILLQLKLVIIWEQGLALRYHLISLVPLASCLVVLKLKHNQSIRYLPIVTTSVEREVLLQLLRYARWH